MTQKTIFRVLVLIIAFASLSAPRHYVSQNSQRDGYQRQTSVELIPRGPDGQRLSLTRAEIYLDFWGSGELVPLPGDRQSAILRLDRAWLCSASTEICKG